MILYILDFPDTATQEVITSPKIITIVAETQKVRKIHFKLMTPKDGEIVIPSLRISAKKPRYVIWVEDVDGKLIYDNNNAYKTFESYQLAKKCFDKIVLFYEWQQQLEKGVTTMNDIFYNGLDIKYDSVYNPLTEKAYKKFEIITERTY